MPQPLVLLDDARPGGDGARVYQGPAEIVEARTPEQVAPALARLEALSRHGLHLAGYLAYEAGLALEPRLRALTRAQIGPLVWFGAFEHVERLPSPEVPRWLEARAARPARIGPLEPQISLGAYRAAFTRLQRAIEAGDIYQANLTFPLEAAYHGDPLALYATLREAAQAGHGGAIFDGSHWLLSFSPELFFVLDGAEVTVRPMKGTRPRSADAKHDETLAAELAASAKDRAENLMIVDLMRNDLSRVAEPGSVKVEQPFSVETYPTVHQMVSTVRARLSPRLNAVDLLRALFPCGSITGAPKIRAMELLNEVERDARGAYCGAIGRIDPTGDAAFNVAIRTLRLTPEENGRGRAVMGVGSAIVADSDALGEWRECLVKGGFVRQPVRQGTAPEKNAAGFDLIETMAFSPDEGVPLLELHLLRLKASAAEFGFPFDRHAVRNAIQVLCFEADAPSRLRLMLSPSGAFSLEIGEMPAVLEEPVACAVLRLPVDSGDWRLRHKTSDRGFYEAGLKAAREAGAGEALFVRDDGLVTEGSFTSVFVERDGVLLTPPLELGLLPGVLRRDLIDGKLAVEAELTLDELKDGFQIGNALRGLMKARLL